MLGIPAGRMQPIVLVIRSTGPGEYAISRNGAVLSSGRRALSSALWFLQLGGLPQDAALIVLNSDTGAESPSFTLRQYPDVRREGTLQLPETRRERGRRCRAVRHAAVETQPVGDVPLNLANLPPLGGRSGVWVDQRATVRSRSQV